MSVENRWLAFMLACMIALLVFLYNVDFVRAQHTHEGVLGQFYQSWMRPDNRYISCCHSQDCTPAEAKLENGRWLARRAGSDGAFTPVPKTKIEQERDSPDGRSHICGRSSGFGEFIVYCFLPASGS